MRRIHFDGNGPVWWHYPFWKPWGCLGCLGRLLLFLILFFIFLFLLSQFRSCSSESGRGGDAPGEDVVVEQPAEGRMPPINDEDIIEEDGRQVVSNRLNVLFQAEVGESDINRWSERFKELYPGDEYQILFCDINTKLMALRVPAERRRELITELPQQIPDILFLVFEEGVMDMGYQPNDTALRDAAKSWHLSAVKAYDAWDLTKGDEDVIVAVVDSYFDLDSPEFQSTTVVRPYNVWDGSDNVAVPDTFNPGNPDPVLCHGTMVAALALGAMDNNHGSAGIAPKCSFMPVSLGARFGCLAMLQGLLFAVNHGAQVVNISAGMSFAEEVASWPVERQIEMARRELLAQEDVWKYVFDMCEKYYVTIVWAAGNENVFTALDASKRGDNTIKVSAVDKNLAKADFSNFGNFAERNIFESTVSAPGTKVFGEVPGGGEMAVDGTSFSAPIVAGAVGLMKSLDISLSTAEISTILRETGRPVAARSTIGPVIQLRQALDRVIEGFLPFSTLKEVAGSVSGDSVRYATTLMRPLQLAEADSTMLPPLVQLSFAFSGNGAGKVYYTSNLDPEHPWIADITVAENNGKIVITQQDAAKKTGSDSESESFEPAVFTVAADSRGKSIIESIVSESIPTTYTPYIKKA